MVQNCFALKAHFMVNVLTVNYMQHSTRIYSLACSGYENANPNFCWGSCATDRQDFEDCICVDTHLPRFEELAYILPHFNAVTYLVIRSYFRKAFLII